MGKAKKTTKATKAKKAKTYKGEEANRKLVKALLEIGKVETPLYPFKADKIQYINLSGKSDIPKYGAYRFSKEDCDVIKQTVGFPLELHNLRAFLASECKVQNPRNYDWSDIIAALKYHQKRAKNKSRKKTRGQPKNKEAEKSINFLKQLFEDETRFSAMPRGTKKESWEWIADEIKYPLNPQNDTPRHKLMQDYLRNNCSILYDKLKRIVEKK